jgi:putative restriction endonuclease
MTKGVLLSRADTHYDDVREERYNFPRNYLSRIREMVGDLIVYYEPKKGGGYGAYVALARITSVDQDLAKADHYYARIADYLEFDQPVPLRRGDRVPYESSLQTETDQIGGYVQSAVRRIPDDEFNAILKSGFGQLLTPAPDAPPTGFGDEPAEFLRPLIEQLVTRPFREAAFSRRVKSAYEATCAFTGLNMRNGGGRSEVEAAHIKPVAGGHTGSDSVRNGLALSRTVHWMFDRGLLSVDSDFRILKARGLVPEPVSRLLNPSGVITLPDNAREHPHSAFLKYHRDKIFKEAQN